MEAGAKKRKAPSRKGSRTNNATTVSVVNGQVLLTSAQKPPKPPMYSVSEAVGGDYVRSESLQHDHVIVHLNTEDDVIPSNAMEESSSSVLPYDAGGNCFSSASDVGTTTARPGDSPTFQVVLGDFQKRTIDGGWPTNTSTWCHWCCHPFEGPPVPLPLRAEYDEDACIPKQWHVTGCFCSFQCAAAFNFEVNADTDDVWDIYAMLNKMNCSSERLLPAPPRLALQVFGGHLSINEFRKKSTGGDPFPREIGDAGRTAAVLVDSVRFPMTYVPQQIEEINEAHVSKPLRFIPIDPNHITRAKEKMQLRRTKPLINSPHTLDKVMNLRIEQ